jgi:hypothetical protein
MYTTRQYHVREMTKTMPIVAIMSHKGMWVGNDDRNSPPKKAAVLGLEKLVRRPLRMAALLFRGVSIRVVDVGG